MITAQEAKDLAGPSAQDLVDALEEPIRKAAKEKRFFIRAELVCPKKHKDFWTYGGYNNSELWKEACAILHDLGFEADQIYEERQFVDCGTEVSWE